MITEFHHVPGRLRVRIGRIKGDLAKGSELRGYLYGLGGVTSVKVSEVTGSVTVLYDSAKLPLSRLLQRFEEAGIEGVAALPGDAADSSPLLRLAEWTGRMAVGLAVERMVQRSALSVLTALL